MKTDVLILAGGSSQRMGGINKQFADIGGVPVIIKSAIAFEKSPLVSDIIIAARECDIDRIHGLCEQYGITKLKRIVPGGASRTESARNAFSAVENADIIMVHDGARPFVTEELIGRIACAADEYGAAIPALPLKDTVKFTDSGGFSAGTPDRDTLRAVQTPQAFGAQLLLEAYSQPFEPTFTDDASVVERAGRSVALVEGDPKNLKITRPMDLALAEYLLNQDA